MAKRSDPVQAAALTVRLKAPVDVEVLGEQLDRLWRLQSGRRRAGARVVLSIVETCGRSPAEREGDAMRLLRTEACEYPCSTQAAPLRATLVSVDAADHLLRLAVPPAAAALLERLVAHLSQAYPIEAPT